MVANDGIRVARRLIGQRRVLPMLAVAALAVAGVTGFGCGDDDEEPASETGSTTKQATSGDSVVIGFASPILSEPDQQALLLGQEKAAEQIGGDKWTVDALNAALSVDKQTSDIDTLISKGVDGIITMPMDPKAMEPAFQRANSAGIPLVGFAAEAPGINTSVALTLQTTCEAAEDAAKFISDIKPGAKVVVVGGPPVPVLLRRVKCFEDALSKHGLTKLGRKDNVESQLESAQRIGTELLTKFPDADAFYALDETTATGLSAAIRAAGKTVKSADQDGIAVVAGCCGNELGVNGLRNGFLTAFYDSYSPEAGAAAVAAISLAKKDGGDVSDLPKEIEVPWKRWDFDNIDEWVPLDERDVSQFVDEVLSKPAS